MGRLFHWESKRMKTLQQIQAEENRELKAMIMVVPIAVLVFLYLAIGVAVTVTQRWFSPCSPYATRTYDRDFERTNALRGFILPVILWGPRFIEHVVQDDMPIRHFIFASDCQWTGQLPEPQRLFARAVGDRNARPGRKSCGDSAARSLTATASPFSSIRVRASMPAVPQAGSGSPKGEPLSCLPTAVARQAGQWTLPQRLHRLEGQPRQTGYADCRRWVVALSGKRRGLPPVKLVSPPGTAGRWAAGAAHRRLNIGASRRRFLRLGIEGGSGCRIPTGRRHHQSPPIPSNRLRVRTPSSCSCRYHGSFERRRTMTRLTLILATLGLTSLAASPAMANKTDVDLCKDHDVRACTRLIDGGKVVDRNLAIALVLRSEGLERSGDLQAAIRDLTRALEVAPGWVDPRKNLARLYESTGQRQLVLETYMTAIAMTNDKAPYYSMRGHYHERQGEFSQAAFDFSHAILIKPTIIST